MALILQPFIPFSGQGLTVRAANGVGAVNDYRVSSMITHVVDNNEEQSIVVTGHPAGEAMALTFNGQTTAPISTPVTAPYYFFQWNGTLASAGTYDLAVNLPPSAFIGEASPNARYEILDGGTLLGTKDLNLQGDTGQLGGPTNTGMFNDGSLLTKAGAAVKWYPLGRFTFTGTAIHVRVTCPPGDRNRIAADNLRIATTDGLTVVRIKPGIGPATWNFLEFFADNVSNYSWQIAGQTENALVMLCAKAGPDYTPDTANLQAKLEALLTIGTGNVLVTTERAILGDGSAMHLFRINFRGARGDAAQPLMTCADPAPVISRLAAGGILPVLHCSRLGDVTCSSADIYYNKSAVCMPTVGFHFNQTVGSPIVFRSDDVITVSWGAGWLTALIPDPDPTKPPVPTACVAATGVAVENRVGIPLHPPEPVSVTMEVGFNMEPAANNYSCIKYTNYCRVMPLGAFPTTFAGGNQINLPVSFPPPTFGPPATGGLARNAAQIPPGPKVFWWDGASDCNVTAINGVITGVVKTLDPGHRNNKIAFTLAGDSGSSSGSISIQVFATGGTGPWTYDFRNNRFLDAGIDPDNFPKFRPDVVARCSLHSLRWLESLGTNNANPTTFQDYMGDPTFLGLSNPVRTVGPKAVARIDPAPTVGPWDFNHPNYLAKGTPLQFTIPNHGFAQDQVVVLHDAPTITCRNTNGVTKSFTPTQDRDSTISVLDANTIVWPYASGLWGRDGAEPDTPHDKDYKMIGSIIAPSCTMTMTVFCDPIDDLIEFCNATGTSAHFTWNFTANDDAVTRVTQRWAALLNPGLKFRPEMSNEVWNFSAIGPYGVATTGSTAQLGVDSADIWEPYTVVRFKHVMDIARAAWIGAGRDPGDFQSIMGSQGGNSGYTRGLADYAHSIGARVDVVCIGDYIQNAPVNGPQYEPDFYPLIARMTNQQHLDKMDEHLVLGGWESFIKSHRDAFTAKQPDNSLLYPEYADTEFIIYEGGDDHYSLRGLDDDHYPTFDYAKFGRVNHATRRDPRAFGMGIYRLQSFQDAGCIRYHKYSHAHLDQADFANGAGWNTYDHTDQLPYVPGDPAQDAIQRIDPADPNQLKSMTGGVLLHWMSLFNAVVTPSASLGTGTIAIGVTGTATATGFTGGTVTWTSASPSIATINSSTGVYTGVAGGSTHFVATGVAVGTETANTGTLTVTGVTPPPTATVARPRRFLPFGRRQLR